MPFFKHPGGSAGHACSIVRRNKTIGSSTTEDQHETPKAKERSTPKAKGIPHSVVDSLEYVQEGSIVQELWWHGGTNDPCPVYKMPMDHESRYYHYARLYTENTFMSELVACLIGTALNMSGVISTMSLASSFFKNEDFAALPAWFPWTFAGLFGLSIVLWAGMGATLASRKVRADKQRRGPDYVWDAGMIASMRTWFELACCDMLNVPIAVRTAVSLFHPRKGVRPYAIMHRRGGGRAWLVGFHSQADYFHQNSQGLFARLPRLVLASFPLVGLQIYAGIVAASVSWFQVFAFVVSITLSLKQVFATFWAFRYRAKVYSDLSQKSTRAIALAQLSDLPLAEEPVPAWQPSEPRSMKQALLRTLIDGFFDLYASDETIQVEWCHHLLHKKCLPCKGDKSSCTREEFREGIIERLRNGAGVFEMGRTVFFMLQERIALARLTGKRAFNARTDLDKWFGHMDGPEIQPEGDYHPGTLDDPPISEDWSRHHIERGVLGFHYLDPSSDGHVSFPSDCYQEEKDLIAKFEYWHSEYGSEHCRESLDRLLMVYPVATRKLIVDKFESTSVVEFFAMAPEFGISKSCAKALQNFLKKSPHDDCGAKHWAALCLLASSVQLTCCID